MKSIRKVLQRGDILATTGARYFIHREPAQTNSLHMEYDFGPLHKKDYVDISTENDSFYCRPTKENVITKPAFATEAIYQRSQKKKCRFPAGQNNKKQEDSRGQNSRESLLGG